MRSATGEAATRRFFGIGIGLAILGLLGTFTLLFVVAMHPMEPMNLGDIESLATSFAVIERVEATRKARTPTPSNVDRIPGTPIPTETTRDGSPAAGP